MIDDRKLFFSRELSWLDFDFRVLEESCSPGNPLLEQLKFLAISDSNLDEFMMVRLAGLAQLVKAQSLHCDPAGLSAQEQLSRVLDKIIRLKNRQDKILKKLLSSLAENGIKIVDCQQLSDALRNHLHRIFITRIMPVLTPFAVDGSHPFPILNSGALEIVLELESLNSSRPVRRAFVEVPEVLDRFIELDTPQGRLLVTLESVVMDNLALLFPDSVVRERAVFRILRDMDQDIAGDDVADLLDVISRKLRQRKRREVIHLHWGGDPRSELLVWLKKEFKLKSEFCHFTPRKMKLKQLFEAVSKAQRPDLLNTPWPCSDNADFSGTPFEAIKKHGTLPLFLPYQSFDPVLKLLEQACRDPQVLAIKQTLYRVSGNSPVVQCLRCAAEAGKQVTVVLELKARFDEDNNIHWARLLDESGAHVIYGVPDLKVHAKSLLIIRQEGDELCRYYHLGTGNYNDKTARQYTDIGIFGCDPKIGEELSTLFNVLTGAAAFADFRILSCAPFGLRDKFEFLIEREIENVKRGGKGKITAKMNSLSDEKMIRLLHRAADAGVQLDLIVRGICCLRPQKHQSNLRIISIVDRYLEHSRIFRFYNNGSEEFYLSSADWMTRNLDRRIELLFPVTDHCTCTLLSRMLELHLQDNVQGRVLTGSGYEPVALLPGAARCRSQEEIARLFAALPASASVTRPETQLPQPETPA